VSVSKYKVTLSFLELINVTAKQDAPRDRVAFIEESDGGIVDPGTKDSIQRKPAATEVIGHILRLHGMRAFVGDS